VEHRSSILLSCLIHKFVCGVCVLDGVSEFMASRLSLQPQKTCLVCLSAGHSAVDLNHSSLLSPRSPSWSDYMDVRYVNKRLH
jgi:hypothetical protein